MTEQEKKQIVREYLDQFPRLSHDLEELVNAFFKGEKIYRLDTGNRGDDDLLFGGTEEDVLHDYFSWRDDGEEEAKDVSVFEITAEDIGIED